MGQTFLVRLTRKVENIDIYVHEKKKRRHYRRILYYYDYYFNPSYRPSAQGSQQDVKKKSIESV